MRALNSVFSARVLAGLVTVFAGAAVILAQSDGSQQNVLGKAGTFAITGARIVTVSGAVIENGTVVIQNGKIAAVGAAVQIPAGAERIDGKGLSVYPGMIDAGTNMGLSEVSLGGSATVDVAEVGDFNANAKAIVGINPHSSHINVTRVGGVTTVLSMPTGGVVSGQAAVIDLWGATQSDMAVVPAFALVVNFPRVTTGGGFGQAQIDFNEAVRRRDQRLEDLKRLFREADAYGRAREAAAKDTTLPPRATDLKLEAMIPYVRGERPVIFTADRERDVRAVIKFVEETKTKGIVMGGQEAWKAAEGLKKNNIPVVFTGIYDLPVRDDDAYDYLWEAPSKMAQAGVRFSISTGEGGGNVRDLPYQAGLAGAFGLAKDEALRSVTLYPAQILGIADSYGSVEAGKIANLVVTDGDLLEARTNVKYVFIKGRMIPLSSRHTDLFDQFKDRVK
jgi:imidazolonepropionase-like amidohydrolase